MRAVDAVADLKLLPSLGALLLAGCTIVPGLQVVADPPAHGENYKVVEVTPEVLGALAQEKLARLGAPALPGGAEPTDAEYRIGPGDVLSVTVWDHPELTTPAGEFRDAASAGQLVSADGQIFFPFAGEFKVTGMTTRDVRKYIASSIARVIESPQVDVRVASFRSKHIQVTGEVKLPGLVAIDDTPKDVLAAINERGGLTAEASRRHALLVRNGASYTIDLTALLSGSTPGINPPVLPGDIVHVPDSGSDRVFILGEVKNSAPVPMLQNGLTLTEALTTVGGLAVLSADDSGVLVFRRAQESADGTARIFALNMGRPQGLLMAGEFELAPRDVIYVKATDFAKYNSIINQMLPTISAIFQIDRTTIR